MELVCSIKTSGWKLPLAAANDLFMWPIYLFYFMGTKIESCSQQAKRLLAKRANKRLRAAI